MPESRNIYDQPQVRLSLNDEQIKDYVSYLTKHSGELLLNPSEVRRINEQRSLISDELSRIYDRVCRMNIDTLISMIHISDTQSVPEAAVYQHIPHDLRQMAAKVPSLTNMLRVSPYRTTIVCNITEMTASRKTLDVDTQMLHGRIVRDLLSRSYYLSNGNWLANGQILQYIGKAYSISLSSMLASRFNLDERERQVLATLFAYFIIRAMTVSDTVTEDFLRANARSLYLPDLSTLEDVFSHIRSTKESMHAPTLTFDVVCQAINTLGVQRLTVSRRIILNYIPNFGPNVLTTGIALEYPPYFIYLLLLALSGRKIGLSFTIKKVSALQKDGPAFINELLQAPSFLETIT